MTARRIALACWLLAWSALAFAQEIVFAALPEARAILSKSDAYSQSMSDFDRSARLATPRTVSEKEFLEFAARAALEWDDAERSVIGAAFGEIVPAATKLALPLPERIYVIKTSGAEDAGAAYTRQNAIVLSSRRAATRGDALRRLLAHELFHIATRAHPQLADRLYEVIGFHRCGAVALPDGLKARRITNPDAPKDEHCGTAKPLDGGNGPRVVAIDEVTGYFEQIGRNTRYLIHPEEIAADNFMLLATGAPELPSPEIPAGIARVLAQYRAAPK